MSKRARNRTVPRERTIHLAAATMVGPDDEGAYVGAVESVRGLVDGYVTTHPGQIVNFAEARNELLRKAADEKYDWALMIDSDERIACASRAQLDRALCKTPAAALIVQDQHGVAAKEKLFRLPVRGEYRGVVHELFAPSPGETRELLPAKLLSSSELPKSAAQIVRKATRDITLLEASLDRNPDDARSWLSLGHSYALQEDYDAARDAYEQSLALEDEPEQAAFAAWLIATMHLQEERFAEALPWTLLGMARHAGLPELPCVAGVCAYALGEPEQALRWFAMAKTFGCLGDPELASQRLYAIDPWARWESPYGISREILRELGAPAARIARETRDYEAACRARRASYPQSLAWSAQFTT